MLMRRFVVPISSVGLIFMGAGVVSGQSYPYKPVRIVASEAGGGGDFVARLIAHGISGPLGQPVILDNRPSNLIAEVVARAVPDGYTLLVAGNSTWIASLLQTTPYDPVKDLSTITMATRSPNILVVHPSLPVKSVKQLIMLAKSKPGKLNYASGATGGAPHIAGELFKALAGIDIVSIPYKGAGPSLNALMGGHVELTFGTAASVASHVKSGRLRALAVTSGQPSALLPGLPTVAETLPGYESVPIFGVWVPARTPDAVVARLNGEITKMLNRTENREKLFSAGVEVVASSAEQFGDAVRSELARLRKLIADAGIRAGVGN